MKHYRFNLSLGVLEGCEVPGYDGRAIYTTIETFGNDLDDCLANASIGREDWHGNELEFHTPGDLSDSHYLLLERALIETLNEGEDI